MAIDVIYYYVIQTDNGSMLPEANTARQEGKYPMIKVLHGCILKLLLHSINSVFILYRTGNMQSAIFLSFAASSSLSPCGLQSTHSPMPCFKIRSHSRIKSSELTAANRRIVNTHSCDLRMKSPLNVNKNNTFHFRY